MYQACHVTQWTEGEKIKKQQQTNKTIFYIMCHWQINRYLKRRSSIKSKTKTKQTKKVKFFCGRWHALFHLKHFSCCDEDWRKEWTVVHRPVALGTVNPTYRGPMRILIYHVVYSHGVLRRRRACRRTLFWPSSFFAGFLVIDDSRLLIGWSGLSLKFAAPFLPSPFSPIFTPVWLSLRPSLRLSFH